MADFDGDAHIGDNLRRIVNTTPLTRIWEGVVEYVDALDALTLALESYNEPDRDYLPLMSDDEYMRLHKARSAAIGRLARRKESAKPND